MIDDFSGEFARYKVIGEKAIAQVADEALNRIGSADGNSIAMIVRHLSGNFFSRFTDFLNTDGEKPWRERDREFMERPYSRAEVDTMWAGGWRALQDTLATLTDADLQKTVTIRQQPLTVQQALTRALAHAAYHVGQIVLLARVLAHRDWEWISIPKAK
jgi:uncharacterized damage-inducible protein DinB